MTPEAPKLLIFAGPNGSGKSTITRTFQQLPDFPERYINPDAITQQIPGDASTYLERSRQAQQIAERQRQDFISERTSFAFETVMSHPSKVALMHQAKRAGFEVTLIFVSTNNPQINVNRVALRVQAGGHDVPSNKIVARYRRTLNLLPSAIDVCDRAVVFDNTENYSQGAVFENGQLTERDDDLLPWINQTIEQVTERQQERQSFTDIAQQRRLVLQSADILSGTYDGPITIATDHYAVQRLADDCRILHDRRLVAIEPDRTLRVTYSQGVSHTQQRQQNQRDFER